MSRKLLISLMAFALSLGAGSAMAEDNNAPIRLIVGYAPGGALDALARAVAEKLKAELKQTVIVDNKPGANQRLAISEVKRSAPDGRTLILANDMPFTLFPHSYNNLGYDPVKDFTRIGRVANMVLAVAVGPKAPPGGMKELLAWIKAHPQEASFGTSGPGGMGQFIGSMISSSIGAPMSHVPYKGGSPALIDLAGGQIPMMIDTVLEPLEMSKGGKVRIIATTGASRLAILPNVPTLRESGIDVTVESYLGIYGPAGIPQDTVQRLSGALQTVLKSPELQARIGQLAMSAAYASPEETTRLQAAGLAKWDGPVKASGFKADQ